MRTIGERVRRGGIGATLALAVLAGAATVARAALEVPKVGSPAPDFTLVSNQGKSVALSQYRGKWVVLYFYPKDFTSGCTIEAHNFQRDAEKYAAANAVVVGVSVDSAESHGEFCAKEGLSFTLLSDPDAKVSTLYGSVMDYGGKTLSARNTFLVDPQGKIAEVFTSVKPPGHSEEVLGALEQLQRR